MPPTSCRRSSPGQPDPPEEHPPQQQATPSDPVARDAGVAVVDDATRASEVCAGDQAGDREREEFIRLPTNDSIRSVIAPTGRERTDNRQRQRRCVRAKLRPAQPADCDAPSTRSTQLEVDAAEPAVRTTTLLARPGGDLARRNDCIEVCLPGPRGVGRRRRRPQKLDRNESDKSIGSEPSAEIGSEALVDSPRS